MNKLLLLALVSVFFSCSQKQKITKTVDARLSRLADTSILESRELITGLNDGHFRRKLTKPVVYHQCYSQWDSVAGVLNIHLNDTAAWLEFIPQAIDLNDKWKYMQYLDLNIKEAEPGVRSIALGMYGRRNVLSDTLKSFPGRILLDLSDLPLTNGTAQPFGVNKLRIYLKAEKPGKMVSLEKLSLIQLSDSLPKSCVDEFGQRIRGSWEGKVKNETEMRKHKTEELESLENIARVSDRDSFGGITGWKPFNSTGFFYVISDTTAHRNTWWLIDPEGNPFWSLGITCIRPKMTRTAVTPITKREFLFKRLPDKEGPYREAYDTDSTLSFYHWNLLRKYESMDEWHQLMNKRLTSWGVNTVGNWSDPDFVKACEHPYTWSFRTRENPQYTFAGGITDVFNEKWVAYVDSILSEAAAFKEDPLLMGYFVDNESGWGRLDLLQRFPTEASSRDKWLALLKAKYGSLAKLNHSWNTNFEAWEDIRNMEMNIDNTSFTADLQEFEKEYADQYFRVISTLLKKHDPNHLYMGCRFTKQLKPEHVIRAAGKYCDILSINDYSYFPDEERMRTWYELSGKPILIGEFHFPLKGERQLPAHYPVFSEEERYGHTLNYIETWAEMPFSLGCHWYQLTDQHITGRQSNGENQLVGIVDITDQPHEELVKALQEAARKIYRWHRGE